MTGDGVLRRVTPTRDPALFWGLRGGKGVLGIVTAVEFDLVEQGTLYGGGLYFDGADAAAVLHTWRTWSVYLPETVTTSVALLQLPPLPMVPPPLAGRLSVAVRFAYTGADAAEGERLLAPVRAAAPALMDGVGVLPYAALDAIHRDPVDPMPAVERSALLRELPAEAVDALLAVAGPGSSSPQVIVEVRQLGGAVRRPGAHASAFCQREAEFQVFTAGIAMDPVAAGHADAVLAALQPWWTGTQLPNFAATDDPAVFAGCFEPATLTRLREVASVYDPAGTIAAIDLLG